VLGVGVQIVLGIFDLDLPCDIRDIIADIKNLAETDRVRWDLIGMLALDLIGLIPVIGALKYSDEVGTLFKNAGKVSVVAEGADGVGAVARHADEAGAWLHGGKVFRYSDETAEAVASGEKLLKESQTVYESFADMMSPDDAAKYLDFLENGSREGLKSAELAGVEKADALLVSRKVEYEDVWDLRNVGDALESGLNSNLLDELANSGVKYNPEDIVAITKTADGKLVWLENGTDTAGLNHIITEHADDFLNKGITQEQIPDYVMNALENGKIVGYQGRGTGRPIYEFTYNGEIHKVAITVGNNGFIVGANPK
ncbi:hypothetical protein, partial [Roseburia inulinivorans]|uniref:hypothetical protein n=1 Tax=Roseburia inulinivorans TaxID=360807 RepID=UPI001A9A319C